MKIHFVRLWMSARSKSQIARRFKFYLRGAKAGFNFSSAHY